MQPNPYIPHHPHSSTDFVHVVTNDGDDIHIWDDIDGPNIYPLFDSLFYDPISKQIDQKHRRLDQVSSDFHLQH